MKKNRWNEPSSRQALEHAYGVRSASVRNPQDKHAILAGGVGVHQQKLDPASGLSACVLHNYAAHASLSVVWSPCTVPSHWFLLLHLCSVRHPERAETNHKATAKYRHAHYDRSGT